MSGKIVFDSVAIIDIANGKYNGEKTGILFSKNKTYINVITHIETLAYPAITQNEEKRIKAVLKKCRTVPLSAKIRETAIAFRKTTHCKLPDSIIAATAIALGAILVTRDNALLNVKFPGLSAVGME